MTKPTMRRHAKMPTSSIEATVQELLDRQRGPVVIPRHLRVPVEVEPFVNAILNDRPRSSWHVSELPAVVAAARTMYALQHLEGTQRDQNRQQAILLPPLLSTLRMLRVVGSRPMRVPKLPVIDDPNLLAD